MIKSTVVGARHKLQKYQELLGNWKGETKSSQRKVKPVTWVTPMEFFRFEQTTFLLNIAGH